MVTARADSSRRRRVFCVACACSVAWCVCVSDKTLAECVHSCKKKATCWFPLNVLKTSLPSKHVVVVIPTMPPPTTLSNDESFVVVWDIETQSKISDMPGDSREEQVRNLEVSCLSFLKLPSAAILAGPEEALRAVEEAHMVTLWRDEDDKGVGPFFELLKAFDEAEVIVSYNGLGFDHPVLYKHCKPHRTEAHLFKVHDVFARLRDHTGIWFKLDNLLKANNMETKTANGRIAIQWWAEGRRDELKEYCEQDVRALARMICLPELRLPRISTTAPNYVFGVASALAACRASDSQIS